MNEKIVVKLEDCVEPAPLPRMVFSGVKIPGEELQGPYLSTAFRIARRKSAEEWSAIDGFKGVVNRYRDHYEAETKWRERHKLLFRLLLWIRNKTEKL